MRTPDDLALLTMCPRCEARPNQPCLTVSGKRTSAPHGPRMRVVFEAQAEQYAEDVHFMQPDDRRHRRESCCWCKRDAERAAR